MSAGNSPWVEARDLERRHPSKSGWLLQHVSLQIRAGERISIVGSTGSGKTLLLRALALLDPLDSGAVLWKGEPIAAHEVPLYRSRVIYLHQRPALPAATAEACLQQPFLLNIHRAKTYNRDRAVTMLRAVSRDETFLAKLSRDLSGGERQITALIRAMLLDPHVLLLDEPTAALDVNAVESVEKLVADWLAEMPQARATVWVSHDPNQVRRVADRVLTMQAGQLLSETK
jgi:putative ABC transport system ATP-binding protein